jgi:hypothetical protein
MNHQFPNKNRSRKVTIRFQPGEYDLIHERFTLTTCRKLSEYLRKLALGKPVTIITRNRSLDALMEELILLRSELNAVGNNFNQAVKKLHTLSRIPEFRTWLQAHEASREQLLQKTETINQFIAQFSDKWLQE